MSKKSLSSSIKNHRIDSLYQRASGYIDCARQTAMHTIDTEMLNAYWCIGRDIVEEEQQGQERAEYGKMLLRALSNKLQNKYKRGFSVDILEKARRFFLTYSITQDATKSATVSRKSTLPAELTTLNLSWSHYVELIKVSRDEARQFYALEASKNRWNVRELRRQIASFLYDRLIKSKDKDKILQLAEQGQEISLPEDAIKEPLVLEFLGAPEPHTLSESNLESALIANLQDFLLELGKGFAFIGRQQRLTFDNDHYYADLVFYHVILNCYIIIDIMTKKLTHADLGQMLLYVNYYDQEVKKETDNPTIGLVLCSEKSDAMVKYLLGNKNQQIFASKYQFHLPTEAELENELKRERQLIQQQTGNQTL